MARNNSDKLPQFQSTQELVDFFDSHDLGEYESELPEADFDVDIQQQHYLVSVDRSVMNQLLAVAKAQQTSVDKLLDSWLKEKLLQAG